MDAQEFKAWYIKLSASGEGSVSKMEVLRQRTICRDSSLSSGARRSPSGVGTGPAGMVVGPNSLGAQLSAYVLRVFPLCALVPRVQGSSGAVATAQFCMARPR